MYKIRDCAAILLSAAGIAGGAGALLSGGATAAPDPAPPQCGFDVKTTTFVNCSGEGSIWLSIALPSANGSQQMLQCVGQGATKLADETSFLRILTTCDPSQIGTMRPDRAIPGVPPIPGDPGAPAGATKLAGPGLPTVTSLAVTPTKQARPTKSAAPKTSAAPSNTAAQAAPNQAAPPAGNPPAVNVPAISLPKVTSVPGSAARAPIPGGSS